MLLVIARMSVNKKIDDFSKLSGFLAQFGSSGQKNPDLNKLNSLFYDSFQNLIEKQHQHNGWFIEENVRLAVSSIAAISEKAALEKWISAYETDLEKKRDPKKVAVIMAGNIPLVGFHDFLCVLISGHQFIGKLSSNDKYLLPFIAQVLTEIEPHFKERIHFEENRIKNIDAVIATGSNNSARYFEYYFGKYPHIIRKNRSSVAIIDGTETEDDFKNLGKDIFRYFGLGCRNVSKLFVPEGYNFNKFFESIFDYQDIINNNKYANNYNYNRTIYLMKTAKFLDNGFLLLKEDAELSSPVAVLYHEEYKDQKQLTNRLASDSQALQCIVSKKHLTPPLSKGEGGGAISFGDTQCPGLSDYADGADTMKFLTGL